MLSLTQRLGSLVQPLLGQACRELRQQRLLNIHEYQVSAQSGLEAYHDRLPGCLS